MAVARLTSKGQITIPKEVRERLGVSKGDSIEFSFKGRRLELRAVPRRRLTDLQGIFPVSEALDFEHERELAWSQRGRELEDSR